MQITESFVLTQRTLTETLIGLCAATFEGIHKLVELNVQVVRDTMTEVGQAPQVMHTITNPQELMTLNLSLFQSRAQMMASYGHQLQEIASSAGSEVSAVVRASTAHIQSAYLAGDESSSADAAVGAQKANGQVDLNVPSAQAASNRTKKSISQTTSTNSTSATTRATDTNGVRPHGGGAKPRLCASVPYAYR